MCRSVEEVAEKFHAGDVLVVPYTTNELLPYLRDAAAIICEEGSTECHAATVGLLLSKPVLVGAGDATRRLEDGVRVSVDCAVAWYRPCPSKGEKSRGEQAFACSLFASHLPPPPQPVSAGACMKKGPQAFACGPWPDCKTSGPCGFYFSMTTLPSFRHT